MDRASDKVSPRLDDEMKHETQGLVRAGRQTHPEEWKQAEPSGEDEPDVDRAPDTTLTGGTPEGMTAQDVELRSQVASYLGKGAYPAVREQLIELVMDNNAPGRVVDLVKRLPSGREFQNVNDVWAALGGHVEQHRF